MSRTLKALFACWTAVAATGTVVPHRHAVPAWQGHGYGWAALSSATDPATESNPHRHFVLAGVEFGAVPDPESPPGGARLDSVLKACHTLADHAQLDAPPVVRLISPLPSQLAAATRGVPIPHAVGGLCPVARHLRTGVLLS